MEMETVGIFLPEESLISARHDFERGLIDRTTFTSIENKAVCDVIERQIASGLPFVTSGELRRKHWAKDFWFGLSGISCEHVDTGHIYQSIESITDLVRVTCKIDFNPTHPFFDDFVFMHEVVDGRAKCRQILPSPANLLLEIYSLSAGNINNVYASPDTLIEDIVRAYHKTAIRLYELGCDSLLYDDTALGLMCDDNYTKRLLQGGIDLIKLHHELIAVINGSLERLPNEMEKCIYISGGDTIIPEWEFIDYPDNVMPKALSSIEADKFFIPLELDNDYAIEVLRHIPQNKSIVLGLIDAHTPLQDNLESVIEITDKIKKIVKESRLAISPRTGFKLTNYDKRALLYEDQWRKIRELRNCLPILSGRTACC